MDDTTYNTSPFEAGAHAFPGTCELDYKDTDLAQWHRGWRFAEKMGYTDLMVDGAPLPHQPDTIIRWLIDRLRS